MLFPTFMAPDFTGGTSWLNSEPLTITQLRGKVVVVDFWTYTCINCIRTLPYLTKWYEKYKDKGLVIIGVHTPEFEFEKSTKNVQEAIKDLGITYPVVQDNEYLIWQAYDNHYWPAKYFIDKDGVIRNSHFGEGAHEESEKLVQQLLVETGVKAQMPITKLQEPKNGARTPETYLGYRRMANFASPEILRSNRRSSYTIPTNLLVRSFALGGSWTVGEERSIAEKGASLAFHFEAKEVYVVMRPPEGKATVNVLLDGKPVDKEHAGIDVQNGQVGIDEDRMYRFIKLPRTESHILTLEFPEGNVEVYAFTFG